MQHLKKIAKHRASCNVFRTFVTKYNNMGLFDFLHKKKTEHNSLFYDTEVHCHILPGIDDGSPDIETSVSLVRQMQQMGIRRIITTSHVTESTFENTPQTIQNAFDALRTALNQQGIEVELYPSAEYRMDEYFLKQVNNNTLLPYPNNYLLIENSFYQPFWEIKELIFDLKLKGYTPVLAHPERYMYYHNTPAIYQELHDMECLFQVNLLSLAGYYHPQVKNVAWRLLEKGMVDFIGSDIHHDKHTQFLLQYMTTKEYAKLAEKASGILNGNLTF